MKKKFSTSESSSWRNQKFVVPLMYNFHCHYFLVDVLLFSSRFKKSKFFVPHISNPNFMFSKSHSSPSGIKDLLKSFCFILLLLNFSQAFGTGPEITWNSSAYTGGVSVPCHGSANGWIHLVVVGGTPPFLYNWSNGSYIKDQSNLSAGNYTVIVTDATSASASATIEIREPNEFTIEPTAYTYEGGYNISEEGGTNGEITLYGSGGVGDVHYVWTPTHEDKREIGGLSVGTYSVVATDENGCSATASITLTEPTVFHITNISSSSQNGYNISCHGDYNGNLSVNATGGVTPYTYQWSNGSYNQNVNEVPAGHYSVMVYDANGASDAAQIDLTQPEDLKISFTAITYPNSKNVSCYGCNNGRITPSITGGISPFTYLWETGQTTAVISNLGIGTYHLTVTDVNGCTRQGQITLVGPDRDDWTMLGNTGSDPSIQFLGTIDNKDFSFRTNNQERFRLTGSGDVKMPNLAGGSLTYGLVVNQNGTLGHGDPYIPSTPTVTNPAHVCSNLPWVYGLQRTNSNGPWGEPDLVNCFQRFGFGTLQPQERIHCVGFERFTSTTSTNYLNIGHDGNGKINLYGTGDLLINDDSPLNVKLCTGSSSGTVITGGNTNLAINGGRVGIGTVSPHESVQIGNWITIHDGGSKILGYNFYYDGTNDKKINDGYSSTINFTSTGDIKFNTYGNGLANSTMQTWTEAITIRNDGKVGLGHFNSTTWDGTYRLYVKDGIRTEKVKVDIPQNNGWSDYVFDDKYKLITLSELERYIKENKHLPDVPTTTDVTNNGIEIGEMTSLLLKKVEELSLYVIQLEKELNSLKHK